MPVARVTRGPAIMEDTLWAVSRFKVQGVCVCVCVIGLAFLNLQQRIRYIMRLGGVI